MMSLRKVVAATDFSRPAGLALSRATRMAQEHGATLMLVHVLPESLFGSPGGLENEAGLAVSADALARAVRERLRGTARAIEQRHGIACEIALESGRPAPCIAGVADDADLLVIGARGEHSIRRWFTGSTARQLLQTSPCPVLLVRRAARQPYARVLAPVDFSPHSFATLTTIARWLPSATVLAAHAFEHPFEGMMRYAGVDQHVIEQYRQKQSVARDAELRDFTQSAGVTGASFARRVEHGHPNTVIEKLIDELHPDLVALASHGKSDLERALLGSVSVHVALESTCDVLVVRGRAMQASAGSSPPRREAEPVASHGDFP